MVTQTMQYAVLLSTATIRHPPSAVCPLPFTASCLSIIAQCPSSIARWQCLPVGSPRLLPALGHCRCSRIPGAARTLPVWFSPLANARTLPVPVFARCHCSPVAGAGTLTSPTLTRSCIHCLLFARGLNSVLGPKVEHLLPVLSARSWILLQTTKRYRVSLRRTT
jgi:hypothetical protein